MPALGRQLIARPLGIHGLVLVGLPSLPIARSAPLAQSRPPIDQSRSVICRRPSATVSLLFFRRSRRRSADRTNHRSVDRSVDCASLALCLASFLVRGTCRSVDRWSWLFFSVRAPLCVRYVHVSSTSRQRQRKGTTSTYGLGDPPIFLGGHGPHTTRGDI